MSLYFDSKNIPFIHIDLYEGQVKLNSLLQACLRFHAQGS